MDNNQIKEINKHIKDGIPESAPCSEHMQKDFSLLLSCDAIFLCEGWEYSSGCRVEFSVAVSYGKELFYEHGELPRS